MRRLMQIILSIVFLFALSLFGASGEADATVHAGSAADCSGCHQDDYSLKGADASSTCLGCHARDYQVLTVDGSAYTPAGDYYWLT